MSSTVKLQDTINWARRFLRQRPLAIGDSLEPAISSANLVLQTMLGAPFKWPWNRATTTFTCISSTLTQDYAKTLADFGFIEVATVQDTGVTPNKWYQLSPKICLSLDSNKERPRDVAAQLDDGASSITFRLMPPPDATYPVSVTYQKAAPLFTSLNSTWAPIPDRFQYIYNWGFLALMYLFADDPRFQMANQKFVSSLLGAAQGLTETEVNIFLNQWNQITGAPLENAIETQQGTSARGV